MWHRYSSRRPSSLGSAALCSWFRSAAGTGRCAGWPTRTASSRCSSILTGSCTKHWASPGPLPRYGSIAPCSTTAARRRPAAPCRPPTLGWRTTHTRWAATS